MNRMLSVLLAGLMLLSPLSALAEATAEPTATVSPVYTATQLFVERLTENEFPYSYRGPRNGNTESILLPLKNDVLEYYLTLDFSANSAQVSLMANILPFDPSRLAEVCTACNSLNASWKFLRFYVNDAASTVTAQYDLLFYISTPSEVQDLLWTACGRFDAVLAAAYPTLAPFAAAAQ